MGKASLENDPGGGSSGDELLEAGDVEDFEDSGGGGFAGPAGVLGRPACWAGRGEPKRAEATRACGALPPTGLGAGGGGQDVS